VIAEMQRSKADAQINRNRDVAVDDFIAFCGAHPVVIAQIWEDLQTTDLMFREREGSPLVPVRIDTQRKRCVHLKNFLRTFIFLHQHQTEKQRKLPFQRTEKIIRRWAWFFIKRIAALRASEIAWPEDDKWTTIFIISVDGVHCAFHEVKHPALSKDPKCCSHKLNGPGLSCEMAMHVWLPRIVWMKRNAITKTNDVTNFKAELRGKIPPGKKVIGDGGCRIKDDPMMATPNAFDPPELKTFKARARMRQEALHAKIQSFRCLQSRFRHSVERHEDCFFACSAVVQHDVELVSPLCDVW